MAGTISICRNARQGLKDCDWLPLEEFHAKVGISSRQGKRGSGLAMLGLVTEHSTKMPNRAAEQTD